jgi:PAS domain S-box-containing protein
VARLATAPVLLYAIGLLGVALTASIGAIFLMRATERPITRMQEDTELLIRGDLKAIQSTVPMKELEALAHSITRVFEKSGGPNPASASVFAAPVGSNQLALPAHAGPVDNAGAAATVRALVSAIEAAVLVVDADSNVVEVNAAAERMFGLIPARVRGKHLLEAITDKTLLAEVLDLLNEIAAAPSGVVTRAVNIPGPGGSSVAGHVSAAGVRQGNELAGSAIIISAGRREEAA